MLKQKRLSFLPKLKVLLLFGLTMLICIVASPSVAILPSQGKPSQLAQISTTTAEQFEQQGRSHYNNGQFTVAADAFRQAARAYQSTGNSLRQAIALSNLALTYYQLGNWREANQAIADSLAYLKQNTSNDARFALAQALDIQGTLYLAQGQPQTALTTWEQSAPLYQQLGHPDHLTENRINQAQALQTLGFYRRAIATLTNALGWPSSSLSSTNAAQLQLKTLANSSTHVLALQSLGDALRVTGNLSLARLVLQHSLTMATQLHNPDAIAAAQFRLGNLTRIEAFIQLNRSNLILADAIELIRKAQGGDRRIGIEQAEQFYQTMGEAIALYGQAISNATTVSTAIQAQLNQLRVLIETEQQKQAQALLPDIQQAISQLPSGRLAIEARINLAHSLVKANPNLSLSSSSAIAQLLTTAIQTARDLQDARSESYALGYLGELYEQTGQLENAQQVTRNALLLAQANNALEIAYRWQWQLGRLLKAQADAEGESSVAYQEAIAAYTEAVNTLKAIRGDLVTLTAEEQFAFRDTTEPIYRQLVALLLQSNAELNGQSLNAARDIIESLQLAELDNFFREACLNGNLTAIDQIDTDVAVFYPIILPDRLAVIISLPSPNSSLSESHQRTLSYYSVPISQVEMETTVNALRDALDQPNDIRFLHPAQQLYNWLIRPASQQLQTHPVKTLVFVLDGVLRNIPMAVLHDGENYLIDQPYNLALTPGLQLLVSQARSQQPLRSALLAGITEARPGFSALPGVRQELMQIQSEIPNTITLLDQGVTLPNIRVRIDGSFTKANFEKMLRTTPFPVVHLATHGQFSSQLDETYILTEDGQLSIADLKEALRDTAIRQDSVLELLVFSACETATGDSRAALGLAGLAVRLGARSTVATLWQVNDDSSAVLMGQFYRELSMMGQTQITKAEALKQAQRSLRQTPDYQHPYFWAPYVLIGNWQ